jgi:hypothetical protein
MHHLSQQHIELKVRRPHLVRYKAQLVAALRDPGLSEAQVQRVRNTLAGLGKPKIYSAEAVSPRGAVNPGPIPKRSLQARVEIHSFDREYLFGLPASTLALYAKQQGLEVKASDPKATLVAAILLNKGDNQ